MALILVVDDDDMVRNSMAASLKSAGHDVLEAEDAEQALTMAEDNSPDLILSDLRLPDRSGIDLLRQIKSSGLPCDVIIMTGYGTVDTAVQAMKEGATDYVTKPFNVDEILVRIDRAIQQSSLQRKVLSLEERLHERYHPRNIIATSSGMRKLLRQVENIAVTDSSVLITGESGTGKELIANAIHLLSPRSQMPFIAVNCGALPESLLESELFGHVKGAFTGAMSPKPGLIEEANGGTLMLDEIGDASLSVQVKLLRVLETGTMRRVGDTQERKVNIRLIAATNKDLLEEIEAGRFRHDLYYRINVIPIHIPPLRQRPEDIPLLAKFFLKQYSQRLKKKVVDFQEEVLARLLEYPWPGNVRELENTIEYAVIMCDSDLISIDDLPISLRDGVSQDQFSPNKNELLPLSEIEKRHILNVLENVEWNQKRACDILQISKVTLYRRLKEYGLSGAEQKMRLKEKTKG